MNSKNTALTLIASSILFIGCSSSDSGSKNSDLVDESVRLPVVATPTNDAQVIEDSASLPVVADPITVTPDNVIQQDSVIAVDLNRGFASNEQARYKVTVENFWGTQSFPQDFPSNAHLSLIGGATHNEAVSFWEAGELASPGIEDMAEAGLIDKLLNDEVTPAIANGTAGEFIEVREFTDPQIDGTPGTLTFNLDMNIEWPLVSLTTMLGPSPDWFVGVSGLSLQIDDNWADKLSVELPLYDAGTKSDITPIMGGPDIIPANPIGYVAYDAATGVYLATDEPQNMARLTFERIE